MTLAIGPYFRTGGTGLSRWLEAGCKLLVYAGDFPTREPVGDALVCGRAYVGPDWLAPRGDPVAAAEWDIVQHVQPALASNPHVICWLSPNERSYNQAWPSQQRREAMEWYALFDAHWMARVAGLGRRAGVGEWAVGTPEPEDWQWYVRALLAMRQHQAVFTRHNYGHDILDENLTLCHRRDRRAFDALGFADIRMAVTELGADWPAWRERWPDVGGYFREWIAPVEMALRQDESLVGAALFCLGDGGAGEQDGFRNFNAAGSELPEYMHALSRVPWPGVQPPPLARRRNQDVINALALAGRDLGYGGEWWRRLAVAGGMAGLADQRQAEYRGPLNLSADELAAIKRRLA